MAERSWWEIDIHWKEKGSDYSTEVLVTAASIEYAIHKAVKYICNMEKGRTYVRVSFARPSTITHVIG